MKRILFDDIKVIAILDNDSSTTATSLNIIVDTIENARIYLNEIGINIDEYINQNNI